jgi:hypothetical protein
MNNVSVARGDVSRDAPGDDLNHDTNHPRITQSPATTSPNTTAAESTNGSFTSISGH